MQMISKGSRKLVGKVCQRTGTDRQDKISFFFVELKVFSLETIPKRRLRIIQQQMTEFRVNNRRGQQTA
jgi:hypothetical protein